MLICADLGLEREWNQNGNLRTWSRLEIRTYALLALVYLLPRIHGELQVPSIYVPTTGTDLFTHVTESSERRLLVTWVYKSVPKVGTSIERTEPVHIFRVYASTRAVDDWAKTGQTELALLDYARKMLQFFCLRSFCFVLWMGSTFRSEL